MYSNNIFLMAMALGTRVYSRYAAFHIFMFFSLASLGVLVSSGLVHIALYI